MPEITCIPDAESPVPLYMQIYHSITEEIHRGNLKEGSRMPSGRQLSLHLGVSRNTIDAAYMQLEKEGYIRSEPRRGCFVCAVDTGFRVSAALLPAGAGESPAAYTPNGTSAVYDFSSNTVDSSAFPRSVLCRLYRETLASCESLLWGGENCGDAGFREAVAQYLHSSRGVRCSAEQVVIGAGTEYIIQMIQKLLGPAAVYGAENPGYRKTVQILRDCGSRVVPVSVDSQGMSIEELEKSEASAVYITPSHQFPLGITMPVTRRIALLKWAYTAENRYIIEDDYDSEYRFGGKPVPALQGLDTHERVIYAGTFSRSIAPSMRISYMVLPPVLMEQLRKRLPCYSCTVSRIEQSVLEKFLMRGHFERHLNRMRTLYRQRRTALTALFADIIPGIIIKGEEAGLHFIAEIPALTEGGEERILEHAAQAGIIIGGVSSCRIAHTDRENAAQQQNSGIPARLIVGYSHLMEDGMKEAVRRLADVIEAAQRC